MMGVHSGGAVLRKILLVDADDTLWENNIYFERVIASVQDILSAFGVEPSVFRAALNDAERKHIVTRGYGTLNFTRSLLDTFEEHLPDDADATLRARVKKMALGIMDHPIEVIEGVPETLEYLSERHSLYLVTKGAAEEQSRKIEKSGLKRFFSEVEILPEKNAAAFQGLVEKHSWNPELTWMIGNSPRSDINPAITAGLNAVFIPHRHTWVLEHEEPVRHPRVTEVGTFADLRLHF